MNTLFVSKYVIYVSREILTLYIILGMYARELDIKHEHINNLLNPI